MTKQKTKIRTKNVWNRAGLKRANEEAGCFYFSPSTLKFFASRVLSDLYKVGDSVIFLTSEKKGYEDYRREYSIRVMNPNGTVDGSRTERFDDYRECRREAKKYGQANQLPTGDFR